MGHPRSKKAVWALAIAYPCLLTCGHFGLAQYGNVLMGRMLWVWPASFDELALLLFFGDILGMAFGIWLLWGKKTIGLIPLLVSLVCPLAIAFALLEEALDYKEKVATWRDTDGTEYDLFTQHILQGNEIWLMRREKDLEQYTTLGTTGWEEMHDGLKLVFPNGTDLRGAGIVKKGSLLLGIEGGDLWLAYDLRSKNSCDVKTFSPFLLLSPTDEPAEVDFKAIMHSQWARPSAEAIKPELSNPNHRVREMAAALLKQLAKNPPTN